jgi:hypothetical protein
LFIVAVPSHPGLQVAFVVLNTLIAGAVCWPTLIVAVAVQPLLSVPVTVYVVPTHKPPITFPNGAILGDGDTVYTKPIAGLIVTTPSQPGLQLAFVVTTLVGAAGFGDTPTWIVVTTVQPAASAPVTVYVVPAHKPLTLFPIAIGPIGEKL